MKALFDTSVFVAAFEVSHPRHSVCLPWLQQVQEKKIEGYLSTHTFAELYSVVTRLPVKPQISPAIAQLLINENLALFEEYKSHHKKWFGDPRVNIQNKKGKAKPYQVKQVLAAIAVAKKVARRKNNKHGWI